MTGGDQGNIEDFKNQLENHHDFPTEYLFKFIIPRDQITRLKNMIPRGKINTKKSKTGKYIGVSVKMNVKSSDEVINIYKEAYTIKGIISL